MVNQMAFNNAGNRLATASFDHTVRIWSLNHPYKQPILLEDHDDWVWSVEFSQNDRYLLAGCRDNLIRTWLLNIDKMAAMICNDDKINRNFTQEEWDKYVAEDIDYECTCNKNALNKQQDIQEIDVVDNTNKKTDKISNN
jgi:WD40 repeat protein